MRILTSLCLALLLAASQATAAAETKPGDDAALRGVETGKVVFDINMGEPGKLALYLGVIRETIADLRRQDVEPDVILAFRGPSVKLISEDREQAELTDFEHLDRVAEQLADLQRAGARMEACSVAMRLSKVDSASLLDGIEPVGNTFVSLTGYHAQGYASIPIQ
ncbi:MAG: DsrE family protein [Gammaproteobacteria bacterium]|nr:DsrE family protein [Gammaproteobacteria bacterium]